MFELSYYGHSHLVPAGGGGGHTPGAPPVQAHVLGEPAPGRKANEHARERGKARSRPSGGGGKVRRHPFHAWSAVPVRGRVSVGVRLRS